MAKDLTALHRVIERAYRGDTARQGWSHEADLLSGQRIDIETLNDIVATPGSMLLMAEANGSPIGCVQVTDRGDRIAYLGLLCVDPECQADGLGRRLIAAAEHTARTEFHASTMTMTVIEQRVELIAYYRRRGYEPTGQRVDFPVPVEPPLFMAELAKPMN